MPRQLHLSVALDGSSHTPAEPLTADHWAGLIGLAEQGALDFVTLDDSFAPPPDDSPGRLDAVAVLARVAPVTSRIGLVPTVTTTHTEPFHTSTSLATLDFVSEGRAGWLVDVSTTPAEARAVGRRLQTPEAELWAEAADAVEVAARLWDSWEDDAEIRDAATGRFIDRDRLHYVDFEGSHFSVRGPAIVPRPPQGRPPVAIALDVHDSDGQWELAAGHADVVLLDADEPTTARLARTALLHRVAESGRDPEALRVLVRVAVDLTGGTGRVAGPGSLPAAGHRSLPSAEAHFTGAAADLAELLADWHATAGVDGFHLLSASASDDLPTVVHDLVPQLRERGLFRADYTGRTLRDHLDLPRPASRYARRRETEPAR
ncbi:LLM class flavin-dependent oxidoreductase [Streptomyces ferrugineus]|uniref:LLM class flavin-dependent oxidoreductase n=1 Tax=Streptomyces ferrugineus TaxID=1413221 RepID=A0A7M2SJ82_9ACTN|nr:LLM class flavin-dependent oxidoreductase [Streptomyces ferrugineus]QOV35538.1 LLM class flavin-dependent oxidoreductase [Streptomyces ferrugineus]